MRRIFIPVLVVFVLLPVSANAETYYVDASRPDDSGDGLSEATAWKTIGHVNSQTFSPGDSILFKREGEWREELIIDWSGSPGNPITFGSYGSGALPIINGALLVTGWTEESSNIWYASFSNEPRQAFFDRARGTKETAKGNLDAANEWYWESNTLYVYSTSDPDTAYTNPGVEADDSSRTNDCNIFSYNDDYIDIKELDLRNPYHSNIGAYYCEHWNVYDCEFRYSAKRGIHAQYGDYVDIYSNLFYGCGTEMPTAEHAIYIDYGSSNINIYENEIAYSWNSGIKVSSSDVNVYRNYVHDNNENQDYSGSITVYACDENIDGVNVYYNLIVDSGAYVLKVAGDSGRSLTNISFYNNLCYAKPSPTRDSVIRTTSDAPVGILNIKNNIFYANGQTYIFRYGDETLNSDYNSYYGWTGPYCGRIDGVDKTWSDMQAVETHSINSDPLFENPSNHDYHLQSNSPCIDNGTDVGLTMDFEGNPIPQGSAPDIGAYEYAEGVCEPDTYYVDATNGNDNNDGRCTNTAWKTISKVNNPGFSYSPGDSILFKRGEIWRDQLNVLNSGNSSDYITFGAYGTGNKPIINGADLCNGVWTNEGGNLWYHTWSTDSYQVFFDGVRGNEETVKADVDAEYDWYYDAGNSRLYVYSLGNPNTVYTNPGVEATKRNICVNNYNRNYIDITGFDLRYGNFGVVVSTSDYVNVYGNDISYVSKRGIYPDQGSTYINIYQNNFSYCGVHMPSAEHAIYLSGSDNIEVYENEISHSWDCGIKVDSCDNVKIYENYIHDNVDSGSYFAEILITGTIGTVSGVEIYYNIIEIGDGYAIQTDEVGADLSNVNIYNNAIWDNNPGPGPKTYVLRIEDLDGLNIKNNIIQTGRTYVLYYLRNTDVSRDYNYYYGWTHASYIGKIDNVDKTFAALSESNSINSDPLFENPSNHDYHLQSNSPCIDNGTDVGLTMDFEGNPVPQGSAPDIGAFEYTSIPTPPLLPGLSWEAEDGVITSPFAVGNGYVFQSIVTLDDPSSGGKASYRFNIENPGDYIIKTIVNASDGASNSFFVNIDSEPTNPYMIWDIINLTNGFEERNVSWRGNGTYDNNEFDPKVFTLTAGEHELIIRGREAYTLLDNITLEYYETLPADLNNDGFVDIADLAIIAANFGKTSGYEPKADVVDNNEIDVFDLVYVASRFT